MKILVARYNENIEWTSQFANVVIYNKGTKLENNYNHEEIMLENVGREGHTYYRYICDNYDNLDDYIIFLQGYPFDHCPGIIYLIISIALSYQFHLHKLYFDFKFLSDIVDEKVPYQSDHKESYEKIFNEELKDGDTFTFGHGALFIVSRDRILKRPKSFYENIVNILSYDSNPYEGYCVERYHNKIFE
jgi:hypothetical protein